MFPGVCVDAYADPGLSAGRREVVGDGGHQRGECRADVGVAQAARRGDRDAGRLCVLDDDVHDCAPFQCPDVRVDPAEALLLFIQRLLDLGLPQPEHPSQFLRRQLAGEGSADLF